MEINSKAIKGIFKGNDKVTLLGRTNMFMYQHTIREDEEVIQAPLVISSHTSSKESYSISGHNTSFYYTESNYLFANESLTDNSYKVKKEYKNIKLPGHTEYSAGVQGEPSLYIPTQTNTLINDYKNHVEKSIVYFVDGLMVFFTGFIADDFTIITSLFSLPKTKDDKIDYKNLNFSIEDYKGNKLTPINLKIVGDLAIIITKESLKDYPKLKITKKSYDLNRNDRVDFVYLDSSFALNAGYGYITSPKKSILTYNKGLTKQNGEIRTVSNGRFVGGIVLDKESKEVIGIIVNISRAFNMQIVHWFHNNEILGVTELNKELNKNNFNKVFPTRYDDVTDLTRYDYQLPKNHFERAKSNPDGSMYQSSVYIQNKKYKESKTVGVGSGVVIGSHTILTNYHVVWDENDQDIVSPEQVTVMRGMHEGVYKETYKVKEIMETPSDIVILKVEEDLSRNIKPLPIAKESYIKSRLWKTPIIKFGYPGTQYVNSQPPNMYISKGILLGYSTLDRPKDIDISLSKAETYPGMSGSPVIDNTFQLLGLHNASIGTDNQENVTSEHLITGETRKIIMKNLD